MQMDKWRHGQDRDNNASGEKNSNRQVIGVLLFPPALSISDNNDYSGLMLVLL